MEKKPVVTKGVFESLKSGDGLEVRRVFAGLCLMDVRRCLRNGENIYGFTYISINDAYIHVQLVFELFFFCGLVDTDVVDLHRSTYTE